MVFVAVVAVASIAGGAALAKKSAKKTVTASLSGNNEVPKGSKTGSGNARVSLDPTKFMDKASGQICWSLHWSKIKDPTMAHIHKGPKGKAGPIVVTFFKSAPSKHSGCVDGVKPSLVNAIIANPAGYYVNVHTSDFPAGAIRGQLK
jgi:hypothetical protein